MPDLDPEREQERLEELDEQIDQARRHAQEDLADIPDPDEPRYADSGDEDGQQDDQTITPPG